MNGNSKQNPYESGQPRIPLDDKYLKKVDFRLVSREAGADPFFPCAADFVLENGEQKLTFCFLEN